VAAADDPKFVYSSHDDVKGVKGVEWTATAEAGLVLTTGNSETTTATGGFHVSRKTGKNKFALEASGAYAKSGLRVPLDTSGNGMIDDASEIVTAESITAETLQGKARYDRFLSAYNSLYIAALASRDVPAGKQLAAGGQLGYSRQLYKSKTAETVAELGYDFSHERLVDASSNEIHSARAFIGHKGSVTAGCDLDLSLELLTNLNHEDLPTHKDGSPLQDTRVNLRFAVSAKIGRNLAIQTSIETKYDHRPGPLPIKDLAPSFVPEAAPLDTILKLQLIYAFAGALPSK
jgi:hypothetical protein